MHGIYNLSELKSGKFFCDKISFVMNLLNNLVKKSKFKTNAYQPEDWEPYEFCPRCEANLTLQKGYENELPYWVCKGCGEMLINPEVEADSDIAWICDSCEAMLNVQEGFSEDCGQWQCTECGFVNPINASEIYVSDEEFKASINSPYRGLSDEAMLDLANYLEEGSINNRDDILLVRNVEDNQLYVKKILSTYDVSVYEYLMDHPIPNMPRIMALYESDNNLIVIEEYIEGATLLDILEKGPLDSTAAIYVALYICLIVKDLHKLARPIIHRDIKPSNIIVNGDNRVYLLDVNVAKWFKEDEIEDTQFLGTKDYAAPEQLGYGFLASSEKTDVYAIGVLLNVMATGKLPKEEKAPEPIWAVVDKCIKLEPQERYDDEALIKALENILR